MASKTSTFGSGPTWSYILTANCTNRTSTQATIKIDLSLGLHIQSSSTRFGFSYEWYPVISGDTSVNGGWRKVKDATPNWSDGKKRNFTWTGTVNLAASKTSVVVKFNTRSTQISGNNYSDIGNLTVTTPVGNTAPTWNSNTTTYISIDGANLTSSIILPENTSTVKVHLPVASDAQGNKLTYTVNRFINDADKGIAKTLSGVTHNTSQTFDESIVSYGAGSKIKYVTKVSDGSLNASSTKSTVVYTKNTFKQGTISSVGSITGTAGKTQFTLNYGFNQGGRCNNNVSYTLSSLTPGVNLTGTTTWSSTASGSLVCNIGIGSQSTILNLNELKNILKATNYKGNINFRMTSKNSYGSSGSYDFSIYIDLTSTLAIPSIGLSSGATIINGIGYYVPTKGNVALLWNAITDPLGTVSYSIYANSGGSDSLLTTTNNTNYIVDLNSLIGNNDVLSLAFKVKAISTYGATSTGVSDTIRTYSYHTPTLAIKAPVRNGNNVTISGNISNQSQLPITFTKAYWRYSTDATTVQNNIPLTNADGGSKFSFNISNLQDKTYNIDIFVVNSLNETVTSRSQIPSISPVLSIRPNGVGINGVTDGNSNLLIHSNSNSVLELRSKAGSNSRIHFSDSNKTSSNDQYIILKKDNTYEGGGLCLQHNIINSKLKPYFSVDGNIYASGNLVYHAGNKPSTNDINALKGIYTNGYWGVSAPNGDANNWLRTSLNGIIPYQSGGASALGTSSWQFNSIYGINIYENNTKLVDKYAPISHSHSYLPLSGGTVTGTITCNNSVNSANSIYIGDFVDTWRASIVRRKTGTQNYEGRYGASHSSIKQTSSSTASAVYGGVIEATDGSKAIRRYLFGNNGFYPLNDNTSYCGSTSHRWQALYCSTGTVYSSSKDEKSDIVPLNLSLLKERSTSYKDLINNGIKNTNMYSYKYKAIENKDIYIGFLGQELEEQNKPFFDLIGSSYITEEGKMQYDIREASVVGILWSGLQDALLQIEELKKEIKILKGENNV